MALLEKVKMPPRSELVKLPAIEQLSRVPASLGTARDFTVDRAGTVRDFAVDRVGDARDFAVDRAGDAKGFAGDVKQRTVEVKERAGDVKRDAKKRASKTTRRLWRHRTGASTPARHLSKVVAKELASTESAFGIDRLLGDIRTGRFEQTMSALTAFGAAITAIEIFTEHDGASFGNKMMWWPIVIVPTAVPVGIASVFSRKIAKTALPFVSVVIVANGLQGTFFHVRGIAQKPGGLRHNLRYNLEMGPPLFAPLLASMVGGMGILAAILRREDR
ncbi:MAG: hypothetical protein ACRDZP_09560 [Acidimicrobiales bacterium]